jgi:hypothetical protein
MSPFILFRRFHRVESASHHSAGAKRAYEGMPSMNISTEGTPFHTPIARLPLWLTITGVVLFIGSVILEARLIWEQTVWTWEQGPQMVGFSLGHGTGAILLAFPLLLMLWTVVVIGLTVRNLFGKSRIATARWLALGLAVSLFVIGELPDGFWQRVFISRMEASPRAGDLLLYAAYRGDLGTVKGLVSHGVPVNATNHADRRTAMHGAAAKGDLPILRYLISKGANIDALDRSEDSPLELAASTNRVEVVKFLTESGAKRIRGDETQREKARHEMVREEIERMNPDSKTLHEEEDLEELPYKKENPPIDLNPH